MSLTLENLGFSLFPEETRDGSTLFSFESPFRMLNGAPFDVFAERIGEIFHIFDDGLTMHEIVSSGVDMSGHYKWAALRRIASSRNVNLSRSGVFEIYARFDRVEEAVANYLRVMFAIDDWVKEQTSRIREETSLVEQTKKLFRRWWPAKELIEKPTIVGISGMQLEFDFMIDGRYVDAIAPTANASAGFLRKVLAIPADDRRNIETIAVIDDRTAREAANREKNILSGYSNVIMISRLARNAAEGNLAA